MTIDCLALYGRTLALRLAGGSGTVVSSRSDWKVETASQPVAGPDPFTVRAEIFTWYSRPFFKPATTQQYF
jgi:hypothetical protein